MNDYTKTRPAKVTFSLQDQVFLRNRAIEKIKELLLPDKEILKIVLIGSSVKGAFGKYNPPGFRGSLFSDFDFIVFVKDDYIIPEWLIKEPEGKPFENDELNLAYRNPKMIDDKYDFEVFFIREKNMNDENIIKEAEEAGIPMSEESENKFIVVFELNCIK